MRWSRRSGVLAVAGAVLAASCATNATPRSPASLAELGACDESHVDGYLLEEYLGEPSAWLRVHEIESSRARDDAREPFAGRYAVVGGDATVTSSLGADRDSLTMHGSVAREVERALPLGEVYVNSGGRRRADDVRFGLLVTSDDFAFLGLCSKRTMTAPLKQRLGDKAYATVRGWVGRTGAQMAATFPKQPTRSPSTETILNPETAPKELLASLRVVVFTVAPVPDSWIGPYTVCTRIEQGWSDCIDLSQRATSDLMVDAYVDPEDPTIEVWLLDQSATLSRPVARLGSIDVGAAVTKAGLRLDDGPRVVATLDASSSPRAAAADSARAARSIAKVAARRHAP